MKTLFRYIYILLCLPVLMLSCSDDEPDPIPEGPEIGVVEIIGEAPVFTDAADSQEIEFTSTSKWTVRADQSWCKVQPSAGNPGKNRVVVTVESNDSPDERNASIILKAGSTEKRITIAQKQKNALLLTSSKAEISAKAQDVTFEVKANIAYDVTIDEKATSWISVSKSRSLETRKHTFSIKENKSEENREGKIFIKGEGFTEEFTVYQQGAEKPQLVLSKKEFIVDYKQNIVKIELQSNTDYKILLPDNDWIKEEQSRALSTYTHYITVAENTSHDQRSAEIQFVYGEEVETVTIIQQQKDAIVLAKSQYEMEAAGGPLDFVVASNVDYEVACSVDWIMPAEKSKVLVEKEFHFVVAKNETAEERSGEIIFKYEQIEQKVTVVQKKQIIGEVTVLNDLKTFESKESSQVLKFNSTMDWTIESKQSWCTVSPSEGTSGEHMVTITVAANASPDERNAGLVLKSGGTEKIVTVVQKQKDAMLLSSAKAEVVAEGDNVIVEVRSNIDYEVVIDEKTADWVSQVEARALTSKSYAFQVAKNTTTKQREGTITFTGNGLTETFKIYQAAGEEPKLVLNQSQYVLNYEQTAFTIELKSNTKYEMIVPKVDWLREDVTRAMSDYSHHFTVDVNTTSEERKAEILFVYADKTEKVMVIQKQRDVIILSTDTCHVEALGGELEFAIQTKNTFSVDILVDWMKRIDLTGDEAAKKLKFFVDENLSEEERVGEILLRNEQVEQKIIVSQVGQIIPDTINYLSELKSFAEKGGEQALKIKASKNWSVSSEQSWCKVTPSSGESGEYTLKVAVEANTTYDERNSALTFTVGKHEQKMTVTQKQQDALTLTSSKIEMDANGGDFSVEVKSNVFVSFEIETETAKWVEAVPSRGLDTNSYSFRVKDNSANVEKRDGTIIFKGGSFTETYHIHQAGGTPQLILSKNTYSVSPTGGDVIIELQSNSTYQMDPIGVDWIHEEVSRGFSSYTHRLTVDANTTNEERSATIRFTYDGKHEEVTITQAQNDALLLDKDEFEVAGEGGDISFTLSSNIKCTVEPSDSWIKEVLPSRAMTDSTFTFHIEKNTGTAERTGYILVRGGNLEHKVTVKQQFISDEVELLNTLTTFATEGGSQELKFKSSKDWRISSDQPWCKVSPSTGTAGESTVTVTTDANSATSERNAALTLIVGKKEQKITVTQKQQDALLLSSQKSEVAATGGNITVEVKSNVDVTYEIDEAASKWVTAVPSRVMEAHSYSFHVADNSANVEKREGTIIFKGGNQTETYHIYQAGGTPQLILTKNTYHVAPTGGDVTIELQSNTTFEMQMPSVDWLHYQDSRAFASYTRIIKVDPNTTNEERSATIRFTYDGKREEVTITQAQNDALLLDKNEFEVAGEGGDISLNVSSNIEYSIEVSDIWIKQVPSSRAMTTETLKFHVEQNPTETERVGEIIFKNGALKQKVVVTQKGNMVISKFAMTHSNKECKIPTFTGEKSVTGTIKWGDSSTETYKKGITHSYRSNGAYTINVELRNASRVTMENIDGVSEIDISQF